MNTAFPNLSRPAAALALCLLTLPLWLACKPPTDTTPPGDPASATNAPASPPTDGASTNATPSPSPDTPPSTNPPPTDAAVPPGTPPGTPPGAPPGTPGNPGTTVTNAPDAAATSPATEDSMQVSFQGANIDMIVQWLAKTTGKSVIKHPQVNCQLTIVSSRNVTQREAIDLVYRGLSLEGFNAVETENSILILPDSQDPRVNPGVIGAADAAIPEGRQRMVKIFQLRHLPPPEARDKIRPVLSTRGTVEIDERANTLMVTDLSDNLRLVAALIEELDITAIGDALVEILPLQHADAEELGSLISLILNAQPGGGSSSSSSGSSSRSSGMPPGMPPGMSMSISSPPSSSGSTPPPSGGQAVRIWPDRTANRLVVSTPRARLPEVRRLVEILDRDKPEDVSIRVLPLRHVQAADLVRELAPLYQKLSGRSLKDAVEIAANERSNTLVVLSSQAHFDTLSQLIATLDTDEAQERTIRTFLLRNADAEDVAKQLQELDTEPQSNRYPYYIFSMSSQSRAKPKMSVVSDRRRNAIVVQAPPAQMEGIAQMIRELDEPVSDDSLAPKIYPLKYISAVDVEAVLNELFLKRQERNLPYWYYDEFQQQSPDRDVGRLYGKVRITSEPYSNALIITSNSKENLGVVEDILRQLDVPSPAGESTLRVALRFAKAATLANHLNILFAPKGSPPFRPTPNQAPQNPGNTPQVSSSGGLPSESNFEMTAENREEGYFPWLGGQPDTARGADGRTTSRQVSDLVGRVRVVPDLRGNALLVSATSHLLPSLLSLIQELDAPTAQVLIEARIIEVATDAMDRLGVRWSPDGSQVYTAEDYDNSIIGGLNSRTVTGFGGRTEVNNPAAGEVSSMLTTLRSGVLSSTINLDVLIQFLKKTTDATVLAEPQINIADNETGRLFVGQQVPFIDRSLTTDVGGLNQTFEYKPVGIILEVTPHINTAGDVALRIRAESSSIQSGQTLFGGAILDTRTFRTDVTARHGETLVLGGIIQKQISDTVRKTPILGDIPGLGWAFKKKDKTARNVELMVFLRPRVTRSPEEARELLEETDRKAPLLRPWREGNAPTSETVPADTER